MYIEVHVDRWKIGILSSMERLASTMVPPRVQSGWMAMVFLLICIEGACGQTTLTSAVTEESLRANVQALTRLNDRYTFGSHATAATATVRQKLTAAMAGSPVELHTFDIPGFPGKHASNVFAKIDGSGSRNKFFIVGAHYDTASPAGHGAAPGADGDASGVAAVVEIARILEAAFRAGQFTPVHSVYFALFDASSPTQFRLLGSSTYVRTCNSPACTFDWPFDSKRFLGAYILDSIGKSDADTLAVTLETDGAITGTYELTQALMRAATQFPALQISLQPELRQWKSDHDTFLANHYPAVATRRSNIISETDAALDIHDTAALLDYNMIKQVTELHIVALNDVTRDILFDPATGIPRGCTLATVDPIDTCGICGGDGSSCVGCDGVTHSGKTMNSCGQCGASEAVCFCDSPYIVNAVEFQWVSVGSRGLGSRTLTLDDDQCSMALDIGFTFRFYSREYTKVKVCSNGFVTFITASDDQQRVVTNSGCCSGGVLPTTALDAIIAPFWSNYDPSQMSSGASGFLFYPLSPCTLACSHPSVSHMQVCDKISY
jgi:hypothetical protein